MANRCHIALPLFALILAGCAVSSGRGTALADPACPSCPRLVCVRGAVEGYGWLGAPMAAAMIAEEKQKYQTCLSRAQTAGYREVQQLEFRLGDTIYLVKPRSSDPVHVVRCASSRMSSSLVGRQGQADCIALWLSRGYTHGPEPACAYWRDDAKPGEEVKIRESCKNDPPQWTLSRVEAEKAVTLAPPPPTQPRSAPMSDASSSILVGTWDGEIFGEFHSGQPASRPYRTLVISSAVEEKGVWRVSALYGFKGTSLSPVQVTVSVSAGDQLSVEFLTPANSRVELRLLGNDQLNGSFTTSSPYNTSSCRVSCLMKFQRMNPPDPTTLVGTWSGTVNSQRATYPFTITFRNDGTWHAISPTLKPGSFDGTWQSRGSNMVWKSITTGRSGMTTLQEANGKRILRLIPDDGTSTVELTPAP